MTIHRTLAGALAVAAIAVPAAAAPAQPADMRTWGVQANAQAREAQVRKQPATARQDLRSPDARDAARTASRSVTPTQDLRSPDARDAAVNPRVVGDRQPPTIGSPDPAPAPVPAKSGDGLDWAPIGLGLAGCLLGVGGLTALSVRRTRRVRVVA
jgi:hypothetical protein